MLGEGVSSRGRSFVPASDIARPQVQIPEALSREYLEQSLVLPLELSEGTLRVAVAGDPDPQVLDDLALLFAAEVETVPVDEDALRHAIRRAMDESATMVELVDVAPSVEGNLEEADEILADVRDLANQPPVIRYVNLLVREAYGLRASDIHLSAMAPDLSDIPAVDMDLPPSPRPWDTDDAALVEALAEEDGHAVVAFAPLTSGELPLERGPRRVLRTNRLGHAPAPSHPFSGGIDDPDEVLSTSTAGRSGLDIRLYR